VSEPIQRPAFLQVVPSTQAARPVAFGQAAQGRSGIRPAPFARRPETAPSIPASGAELAEELSAASLAARAAEARAEAMERVAHAVEVLRLQAERLGEQARNDALEIGFLVARRILEAELSTSPEALFALVRSALKRAGDSRRVVVRVHPGAMAGLAGPAASGELSASAARLELQADPALEPGDVMVDTDFGRVDGRLRTRFEELYRAAGGALEEGVA